MNAVIRVFILEKNAGCDRLHVADFDGDRGECKFIWEISNDHVRPLPESQGLRVTAEAVWAKVAKWVTNAGGKGTEEFTRQAGIPSTTVGAQGAERFPVANRLAALVK